MYAVLGWVDGFGHDTFVKSIHNTREEAIQSASEEFWLPQFPYRIQQFEFGEVDFDYDEAERVKENEIH